MTSLGHQQLIPPYGGRLIDVLVGREALAELTAYAGPLPSLQLSDRALRDLELLASGHVFPSGRAEGVAAAAR